MNLLEEVIKGNPRAIAKAISLVENDGNAAQQLMRKIFLRRCESVVLGVTGAPGSGKSTLVDQMIGFLRSEGQKIGIVAVDPSSPFSGGAVLGDRIRMMRHSVDPEVFIRSMATRGHLGGLAQATGETIAIFEAAGKNTILVETVGVGQDEVEVVKLADVILVILNPGAGDDIQAFKAGIMEIGDIFVLNKADHPGASKLERQLKAMLELAGKKDDLPPVVKTVATEGKGVSELMDMVRRSHGRENQELRAARKKRLIYWMLKDIIGEKVQRIISRVVEDAEFDVFVEKIFTKEVDPYTVADSIMARLKDKYGPD